MKERWRILNGFKNVVNDTYDISDFGNVRLHETKELIHMKIANKKKHPYYAVYLKCTDNKKRWILVHQLVAYKFVKVHDKYIECNEELVPDHLDNNGLNNYFKNLQWKTRGENVSDAFKMGYCNNAGENNKNALVSDNDVIQICEHMSNGKSYNEIISIMGFPNSEKYKRLLVRIKNRLAWTHISSNYKFDKSVGYVDKSRLIIKLIPRIKELMDSGYTNAQIYDILWKGDGKRDSKMETLRRIRNKEIYKEFL